MKKTNLFSALILLSAAGSLKGQLVPNGGMTLTSAFRGIFRPVIGAGAEYEATGPTGRTYVADMAVVAKHTAKQTDGYWIQVSSDNPLPDTVTEVLVVGDGPEMHSVTMSLNSGGRGAVTVPVDSANSVKAPEPVDIRTVSDDLGSESVTVPAGTFSCEHYRTKDGTDEWVADAISPFGLVKVTGKQDNYVLVKILSNVKNKI
ncbi:MAG TPA: hypothetical protein VJT08_17375 [Terriglobales bacterium]|nr:hypothetical protein [Terriglobales bacterium]